MARPAERPLLFQGAGVIWSLECRPLRLSCRSRRHGHARNAKQTIIRLLMVSAIIGLVSPGRCSAPKPALTKTLPVGHALPQAVPELELFRNFTGKASSILRQRAQVVS